LAVEALLTRESASHVQSRYANIGFPIIQLGFCLEKYECLLTTAEN